MVKLTVAEEINRLINLYAEKKAVEIFGQEFWISSISIRQHRPGGFQAMSHTFRFRGGSEIILIQ